MLDSELPKHERWVLVSYARWAINGREAWPSLKRVTQETGLSERAVRNAIRELERRHHLLADGISNVGTRRYIVKLPAPRAAPRHSVPPPGTPCRKDRHPVPPRPAPRAAKIGSRGTETGNPPNPPKGGHPLTQRIVSTCQSWQPIPAEQLLGDAIGLLEGEQREAACDWALEQQPRPWQMLDPELNDHLNYWAGVLRLGARARDVEKLRAAMAEARQQLEEVQ